MSANLNDALDGENAPQRMNRCTKWVPTSADRLCHCLIVPGMSAKLSDTLDGENSPEEINLFGTNVLGTIMQSHDRSADEC